MAKLGGGGGEGEGIYKLCEEMLGERRRSSRRISTFSVASRKERIYTLSYNERANLHKKIRQVGVAFYLI